MQEVKISLAGLNELDAEELSEAFESDSVELTRPEVKEGELAEPATIIATVKITTALLAVFALWLSKKRRSYILKKKIKITYPDGREEESYIEVNARSESEAKIQITNYLKELFTDA
ncbi:hypothetical protein [Microbulbifer sp. YPW16]|uniref:hypothetical protein n=1 Tax=Microbulbifer sp. YPW16 TaxID=2904242 RepID=UPI001E33E07F|nr:hypothetical protein [Microbulbifer sp. YPW16]UHQ54150.1 hypothetical protein LVE68_11535 [Microbulbifer sp. YPW16]